MALSCCVYSEQRGKATVVNVGVQHKIKNALTMLDYCVNDMTAAQVASFTTKKLNGS